MAIAQMLQDAHIVT